ncbi:MAG: hypothetical protein AAB263_08350, partial [Planctomycetota bacterium]
TGATYIAPLDVTLGIRSPSLLVGPLSTNAQGATVWTIPVPPSAVGRSVWFQAVQYQKASNVVAAVIL